MEGCGKTDGKNEVFPHTQWTRGHRPFLLEHRPIQYLRKPKHNGPNIPVSIAIYSHYFHSALKF